MEEKILFKYPRSSLQCMKCSEKDQKVIRFRLASDDFAPYKVEVIQLQNEYIEDKRLYRIRTLIRWNCPSCGVQMQGVRKIRDIPIEIFQEICICPMCGGNMDSKNEKISLKSEDIVTDIIELSAEMICVRCEKKMPLSKKLPIKFQPIWNYINQIRKIKLSKDGIEIER